MVLARWPQELECPVLLLHELGAVHGHNIRHRRPLHREPILPRAVAVPRIGEAASAPARLAGEFVCPQGDEAAADKKIAEDGQISGGSHHPDQMRPSRLQFCHDIGAIMAML